MVEIVPYNLPHFPRPCGSDAGGRIMQEQLSRATHGAVAEYGNDIVAAIAIHLQSDPQLNRFVVTQRYFSIF